MKTEEQHCRGTCRIVSNNGGHLVKSSQLLEVESLYTSVSHEMLNSTCCGISKIRDGGCN